MTALGCQCRTRVLYATADSKAALEAEYSDACRIRPAWAELVDQAGLVDFDLSETKTAFSITTRQQVTRLLARLCSSCMQPSVPLVRAQAVSELACSSQESCYQT